MGLQDYVDDRSDVPPGSRRNLRSVLPVVAIAFAVRLLFVCLNYRSLPVSDHFERFGAEMGWTARSLALGQGFSSPFYPQTGSTALVCPLYPLLLAGIFKIFGVYTNASAFAALTLNAAFSSVTAAIIFFGMRDGFGYRTAKAGAWIWALYPYAIYYSAAYLWDCALTSMLFACCFFLGITRLARARLAGWAGYGVLAGLTALSNPAVLSLVPVLTAYTLWRRRRMGLRVVPAACACAFMLLLTLAPWTVRNLRVMHEPTLMRDGFWGEFYAGNAGDTSHSNPGWAHPASNSADMERYRTLGETGYMAWKHALSVQRVKQFPLAFATVSLRRVGRFWTGYWSFSRAYLRDEPLDLPNVPFCAGLTLLMMLGVRRLCRSSMERGFPYLAALLLFPLPYYITHASMDYRQPIEPIIVSLIAYAATSAEQSRKRSRTEQSRLHAPRPQALKNSLPRDTF